MDMQNMDLMGGSLQISTDVIAKIARCAAMEIDGVADVACGRQQSKKAKELLEMVNLQPPVTVEMREGTADITLNLIVRFGTCVPVMAEKVQKKREKRRPEHDAGHGQPRQPDRGGPCQRGARRRG